MSQGQIKHDLFRDVQKDQNRSQKLQHSSCLPEFTSMGWLSMWFPADPFKVYSELVPSVPWTDSE